MLSEPILYIGLAQSLFAAFVLATMKPVSISDRILIVCLLTISLKFLIFSVHMQHAEFFDLQFSMGLIPLTFGPFIYLYTVYLVDSRERFAKIDLLHALPFLILTALYFMLFQGNIDFTDVNYFQNDEYLWVRVVYGLIFFTSILIYTGLTFLKLRAHRKGLGEYFSYESNQLRLLWLNYIFALFALLFMIYFATGIINALSYEKVIDTDTLAHFGLTLIAFSVSYFGLRQPAMARTWYTESTPGVGAEPIVGDLKKNKGRFTEEEARDITSRLNLYMEESKPHLNPELALSDLASEMQMTKNDLTDLLNNHIGKNFFSFVNDYRLGAVINKFENPDYNHFTIIAVAYDCGFNSKSTFNSLFKQFTGRTPSEYKKAMS